MIGKSFDTYFYTGGTQIDKGVTVINMDSALVDRYKQYTDWETLQDTSNVQVPNVAVPVNSYIGVPIINKTTILYSNCKSSNPSLPSNSNELMTLTGTNVIPVVNSTNNNLNYRTVNGTTYQNLMPSCTWSGTSCTVYSAGSPFSTVNVYLSSHEYTITNKVFYEDMFNADGTVGKPNGLEFRITGHLNNANTSITSYKIEVRYNSDIFGTWTGGGGFNIDNAQGKDADVNNPYDDDGNNGGDGDNGPGGIDPTDVPPLPDSDIANCGLFTLYKPTLGQIQALGQFLWSGLFDVDTFKKLFTDPMQCLIGLAILPCEPASAGSKSIKFGSVDSNISSDYCTTQYKQVECGSVRIGKDIGSFLDYTDTKISIFLPFIGFREIAATDVMGASISVTYNVDCLTGSCVAFVKHSERGVLYAYNGSCIANIPLTGANFSGAVQNAVSAVASGAGIIAGMASGAAPIAAMGAVGLLTTAANVAINSKPTIQRSGNIGGAAGLLSGKRPFVVIERPNYSVPDFISNYQGYTCNKTAKLSDVSGFTMVESVHLDGINATTGELTEIEALLKQGVIL